MATWLFLLSILMQFTFMEATTHPDDLNAMIKLKKSWDNVPPNWAKNDPCGRKWDGISCNNNSRVTAIKLSGLNVRGSLPNDMPLLSELEVLDLSNNRRLNGNLPANIGILTNLKRLVLVGCNFSGPIPESIGSLSKLESLLLNTNRFTGTIPHSVGNLSRLVWFDVTDNQLTGEIPVSNETTTGMDNLTSAEHFHLGRNKLSGVVPPRLFSSRLTKLIHLILDHNLFTGAIPETVNEVEALQIIRADWNSFIDSVPSLNKLTKLSELYIGNNLLTGPLPDLSNMTSLRYIDLSNSSFDASDVPTWLTSFPNLTTLHMENTNLQGSVPQELFSLPNLQTIVLSHNNLNGTLSISSNHGDGLTLIDLRNNSINGLDISTYSQSLLLGGNPVCGGEENVCSTQGPSSKIQIYQPPKICQSSSCSSDEMPRKIDCKCIHAYIGYIVFRSLSFSNLNTSTYFDTLERSLVNYSAKIGLPIESISLILATLDSYGYLNLTIAIFPSVDTTFNRTGIVSIGNNLNDHQYTAPRQLYGPFYFIAKLFNFGRSKTMLAIVVGVAVSLVLLVLLVLTGIYAYRQRKKAEIASRPHNPFASWDTKKGAGDIPRIREARWFSSEDIERLTNGFSEKNEIGHGGYGTVYKATLPGGQEVAIKRAEHGSLQGAVEFKTEIELLSRIHHRNIVNLVGFCYECGEQMLMYEYVKGGTLSSVISGKLNIQLDWPERLQVALGAARGLAYLHDSADPPIIHRDVKSSNIMLDENLNAKVGDFGLSMLMKSEEKDHFTTEVKGTLGYLAPECYSSHLLTVKSDVYSFGVVLLELLTGKPPIENGKHIVRAVNEQMLNPTSLIDPAIDPDIPVVGLNEYLGLSLKCVENNAGNRPCMREVVKELERIMEADGMSIDYRASSFGSFGMATLGSSTYTSSDPSSSIFSGTSIPLIR